ncbi:MAG: hypothetical protein LC541_02920 [Candidatus Thiodiazotropha sp.]|nr:hypothetical protein [Candidatus Thiodiazotropha sp.]MCM8882271.1 hypothetical protein [Candidatus Thiodiazotropha sp.]MCM8921980.1 hypothetical protein [Candidatus Thiodiazotropha sp.]
MEREFNFTDGTPCETGASTDLKQFHLLSSEPAVAGGLWRFAPLPGFSFLLFDSVYLLLAGLSTSCVAIGIFDWTEMALRSRTV